MAGRASHRTGWPGSADSATAPPLRCLPDLEQAAVQWQAGHHQPNALAALAALVVAHDVAVHSAGIRVTVAIPDFTARLGDSRPQSDATATPLNSPLRRKVSAPAPRRRGSGAGWDYPPASATAAGWINSADPALTFDAVISRMIEILVSVVSCSVYA